MEQIRESEKDIGKGNIFEIVFGQINPTQAVKVTGYNLLQVSGMEVQTSSIEHYAAC